MKLRRTKTFFQIAKIDPADSTWLVSIQVRYLKHIYMHT